jgi:hypothetical protein
MTAPRPSKPRGIEWLKEFGYVPEEDFAAMLGVTVKTLKNRPHNQLPEFAKVGHRRLFRADSVREYFARHTVRTAA